MTYDPKLIKFSALLDVFWSAHSPTRPNSRGLYQKGVFYHTATQKAQAEKSRTNLQAKLGRRVTSTIDRAQFSLAREADQKYYLRHNSRLWKELSRHYPNKRDITNSAAAAKINGYLVGNSQQKHFQSYKDSLGLSPGALTYLQSKVPKRARHIVPQCIVPNL